MQRILMVGKPNCGKSLLFNQLTGLRQKVANYPGITVEITRGKCDQFELVDLPGAYSLNGLTRDEVIAVEEIKRSVADDDTSMVLVVLDATRLAQSLVMGLQVQRLAFEHNKPVMFALNFIDEVKRVGETIDTDGLSKALGSPVLALSARSLDGLHEFKQSLLGMAGEPERYATTNGTPHAEAADRSQELARDFGIQHDIVLKNQNRIDNFMLNNWTGGLIFIAVMFVLFQSIFTLATPLMDGVESFIETLAGGVGAVTAEGVVHDFINDAIFGGFGSFLVFVPQIMVLTLIIGLLEDSGYLARAALMCHRPLSFFGLSGRSFIPYLSGHACAIPAIMAARTIESPHKRLITMLTIPLMSCSARLPVYALLVAVLVPANETFLGIFNMQGAAFFGLYFFGIFMALVVSQILNRFLPRDLEKTDMPFILELPTYRLPHWKPLFQRVLNSGIMFIKRAGPIIFMVSVGIWILGYFPLNSTLQDSWLGQIGHFIEPVFAPMGLDWRYGVAILMSFLAREVFVGALGTLFGLEGADEDVAGLAERVQADGMTTEAGLGLMLFYVVALQCVATVAMLKGESGSSKLSWGLYVAYGLLAYAIAVAVNQIGGLL
ncbi:MAG TPA: ferrous iron transporter B [Alteromonas sp.]|jgi:ferrous iron transport protein B|nr:ferrous iron transporter B [Alteromonas sp.]HCA77843.1 ferrous iron transporter B [Alteromonas sp.]HCB08873.1 ferrous iron transporter B [Alteromonas sp.]HCB17763.1 ferrous iron transporter B [Alteromonas sp.]HCL11541.1 ferrous iron transporter B [Alteromonas sp.]|tara:strand:+ start:583 stop:2403 length:1821 start_codon:yes stop_codon:yes gene_type:complete